MSLSETLSAGGGTGPYSSKGLKEHYFCLNFKEKKLCNWDTVYIL